MYTKVIVKGSAIYITIVSNTVITYCIDMLEPLKMFKFYSQDGIGSRAENARHAFGSRHLELQLFDHSL